MKCLNEFMRRGCEKIRQREVKTVGKRNDLGAMA